MPTLKSLSNPSSLRRATAIMGNGGHISDQTDIEPGQLQ
jgi:hypothetical protein